MKIKAILLDAGGVLLDETKMERTWCSITVSLLRRVRSGYSEADYWADVEESVVRFAPTTRPYILWKHCGGDRALHEQLLSEFRERQAASMSLALMDGIATELKALSESYKLLLAGQYGARLYELLDRHGIAGLFANRLSQADFSITKPDPRYLQQIAQRAGLECGQCVMVGDRIDNDVVPARQTGMGAVLVRTGIYKTQTPRLPEEVPDIDLPHVRGMANAILKKWNET